MTEFLKRCRAVSTGCVMLIMAAAGATSVHAQFQPPVFIDLDVSATYEYPAEVTQGETFPVYVRIRNNSDHVIEVPFPHYVLMLSDARLVYQGQPCSLHCVFSRSRMIEPGGSVLIHAGDVHTSTPGLNESQVGYGDAALVGFTADGERYRIDIEDILPVTIVPATLTPAPTAPPRQPLVVSADEKTVYDPNTGYDWLRFEESVGVTEQELHSRLQAGGDLQGFSVASHHQVQELLLNHLHAAGIAATPADLFSVFLNARNAVAQFVDVMQYIDENDNKLIISGIVSDSVPDMDGQRQYAIVQAAGDKNPDSTSFSSPMALDVSVVDDAALQADRSTTGVWLVKGAPVDRHLSSGKATYADDYLFLPNVRIDGVHYRLEMYRKDGTQPSFVITDIRAASAADLTRPAVEFDAGTGHLVISDVEIISDWPAGTYDLTLAIVPETDLPLAILLNVSQRAD